MIPYGYLVAVTLLRAPPDSVDPKEVSHLAVPLAPYLQNVAVAWQILDRRELNAVLVQGSDHAADVRLLQERRLSLADAPCLDECERFPGFILVNEMIAFNRNFHRDLSKRLAFDRLHAEALKAALAEADQLYQVWDTLRDARCEHYYVTNRRQSLRQLRELIGPEDFYSGRLPPHVPLWRFPEER